MRCRLRGLAVVLTCAAALTPTARRDVLGAAARAASAGVLAPRRAIASPLDPTAVGLAAAQSFKEYRYRAVAARRFAQLRRVAPPQFIAATLGDGGRDASAGDASGWALWRENPSARGARPRARPEPTGAACGGRDWWFEERGLLLERPDVLPAGTYLVTGGRAVTAALTVVADARAGGGAARWALADGARVGDVALLASRVARYTPAADARRDARAPPDAAWAGFPVAAGAAMPAVSGCDEQEYAVLLVVGIDADGPKIT